MWNHFLVIWEWMQFVYAEVYTDLLGPLFAEKKLAFLIYLTGLYSTQLVFPEFTLSFTTSDDLWAQIVDGFLNFAMRTMIFMLIVVTGSLYGELTGKIPSFDRNRYIRERRATRMSKQTVRDVEMKMMERTKTVREKGEWKKKRSKMVALPPLLPDTVSALFSNKTGLLENTVFLDRSTCVGYAPEGWRLIRCLSTIWTKLRATNTDWLATVLRQYLDFCIQPLRKHEENQLTFCAVFMLVHQLLNPPESCVHYLFCSEIFFNIGVMLAILMFNFLGSRIIEKALCKNMLCCNERGGQQTTKKTSRVRDYGETAGKSDEDLVKKMKRIVKKWLETNYRKMFKKEATPTEKMNDYGGSVEEERTRERETETVRVVDNEEDYSDDEMMLMRDECLEEDHGEVMSSTPLFSDTVSQLFSNQLSLAEKTTVVSKYGVDFDPWEWTEVTVIEIRDPTFYTDKGDDGV